MKPSAPKTICHTPTPGKQPTAIPTWKYDLLRSAILTIVPADEPGIAAKGLPEHIQKQLAAEDLKELGSVAWHATSVRLNMEVEGELRRVPRSKPLHIVRVV